MLIRVLALVTCLTASAAAQSVATLDLGREPADWQIFDMDGDGRSDVVTFFRTDDHIELVLHRQVDIGKFETADPVILKAAAAIALGAFSNEAANDVALIGPSGVDLLSWDPEEKKPTRREGVARVESLFRAPPNASPAFWHWPTDVDGDGRDDLVVPGEDGLIVLHGRGGGAFSEPMTIPMEGERVVDGRSSGVFDFVRSYPRPVFADLDADGRHEVCWFDDEGFAWRAQSKPREFASTQRFALKWISGQDASGVVEQTDITLKDLDGDDRADLVLSRMSSREGGITDMQTTLIVFINRGGKDPFDRKPSSAVILEGVIGVGPHFRDADGDGHVDLVYGRYGAKISDAVSRFLGRVPVTLHVHRGTGKREAPFSTAPDFTESTRVATTDFERWGARHSVALHQDLDADGIIDLFEMRKKGKGHELTVRLGKRGPALAFEEKPALEHEVKDVEGISWRELGPDGKTTIVVAHKTGFEFITLN